MAYGLDVSLLPAYTDQLSETLIAKSTLKTDLMQYLDVKSGYTSGTFSINLVDASLPVVPFACNNTPQDPSGVAYTQVNVTIESLQSKTSICVEDLRNTYQSYYMAASLDNDVLPFEEVISESYADKITAYNEGFLINGIAGGATGLKAQITSANGAQLQGGVPAVWDVNNAIDQALDLYDAIGEAAKDRDDLIMVVSPASYRTLTRSLVAANLNTVNNLQAVVEGNEIMILPGTNIQVVKSQGLIGSDYKFAGPGKSIIAAMGLNGDGGDKFRFFYSETDDQVLFRGAWRLGVGVSEVNLFATNDLA